jgi:tyrosinase
MNSLESVHGSVPVAVGGNGPAGHKSVVPVAAFDPIFWMHHYQIERLLTLWMAIYYESKVPDTPEQLRNPFFLLLADKIEKKLDPLRKTATEMVTSNDIQSTLTYGYIYPEIKAHPNVTPEQLSRLIYNDVERLYGGSSFFQALKAKSDVHALEKAVEALALGNHRTDVAPTISNKMIVLKQLNPGADHKVTPDTYREWIVNVSLDKFALGGSGSVTFFLGPEDQIPSDPAEWHTSEIYVGSYDIFAYTDPNECRNCKEFQDKGLKVGGTVYLTEPLIHRHVALTGDEPEKYIKENLHWRCHDIDGNVVPNDSIPTLEVVVQSSGYRIVPGQDRPERTPRKIHEDVTRGRVGGIKEDEPAP